MGEFLAQLTLVLILLHPHSMMDLPAALAISYCLAERVMTSGAFRTPWHNCAG